LNLSKCKKDAGKVNVAFKKEVLIYCNLSLGHETYGKCLRKALAREGKHRECLTNQLIKL
ncbi:MAG: hypothetical protein IIW85_08060, partial [Bacteroidaceae bacterium]|nr:hypothetical protein [Bacteroidaceae bacterium]